MSAKSASSVNDEEKTVVILSNSLREGVADKITALNYKCKRKVFGSSPENWLDIIKLLQNLRTENLLVAVFVHLTEETLFKTSQTKYEKVWPLMLDEIRKCKSATFVYEDNLFGIFNRINEKKLNLASYQTGEIWEQDDFHQILSPDEREAETKERIHSLTSDLNKLNTAKKQIMTIIDQIRHFSIEIIPYKRNLDITLRIQEYLDEIEGGIFLRLYIPNGRFQAEQFANILILFEKYIHQIEGKNILIENRKTNHGIIYVFKDKSHELNADDVNIAFSRFQDFMEISQINPSAAEQEIINLGVDRGEAIELISRFAGEYQRIKLQTRQETERVFLALRHKFESEILELSNKPLIVDQQNLPTSAAFSLSNNYGPITINISHTNSSEAEIIQSKIENTLNGDVIYTRDDRLLLELFDKYEDTLKAVQLKTDLAELNDESSSESTKTAARQKILGFLHKHLPTIGESIVKGLASYLEKKITGL